VEESGAMSDLYKLDCDFCDDHATWWNSAPPKSATSDEWACDAHKDRLSTSDGWDNHRFEMRLVGERLSPLPFFLIDGEWKPWPKQW
jgi:hypothetical protein